MGICCITTLCGITWEAWLVRGMPSIVSLHANKPSLSYIARHAAMMCSLSGGKEGEQKVEY